MFVRLMLVGVLALLTGCAGWWAPEKGRAVAPRYSKADAHLLFIERLQNADTAEMARIGEKLAKISDTREPSPDQRLRQALWLAQPGHEGHDRAAARQWLVGLEEEGRGLTPASLALIRLEMRHLRTQEHLRAEALDLRDKLRALTSVEDELELDTGSGSTNQ